MEIAIISDTHMPRGRRRLPEGCIARLRAADLIIHAGDLVEMSVLKELNAYGEVVAVHGEIAQPMRAGALLLDHVAEAGERFDLVPRRRLARATPLAEQVGVLVVDQVEGELVPIAAKEPPRA